MTNIEKLKSIGMLGDVRQRCGADNREDETHDSEINELSNSELVEKWCGWHLGDGSWWTSMKGMFDNLEEMDKNN